MEDESSFSEPSVSSSLPIVHPTNLGANLSDAPDSEIESAFSPPDWPKVLISTSDKML
jgi:hypothetical protein